MAALRVVLSGLALLLLVAPALQARGARSPIEQAIGAYERGDLESARRMLQALANQGLPAADHNLGVIAYDQGRFADAQALFRRAADAGFVTSMLALGQLHESGRLAADGRPEVAAAFHWWRLAAERGSVQAMVEVGTAYYLGRGAALDKAQAAHWYRQAAQAGEVGAQYLIAAMYESGDGVAADLWLAAHWYAQAAANGDVAAPGKLAEVQRRQLAAREPL